MKLVVPVRLYPGAASEAALRDTLALCNEAANLASAQAFRMRVMSGQARSWSVSWPAYSPSSDAAARCWCRAG